MRVPPSLQSLVDFGIIQEVVRPLMSGKEAQLYIVVAGGNECVAKIYKEANDRSFKHRADYTDGRRIRNTRDRRAMEKGSRHGRAQQEAAWRSAEVDVIYKLRAAGVRVPAPVNFMDGVLVMELVTGPDGQPAPRLGDVQFSSDEARAVYDQVMMQVVGMLCAGVVHGDLSDFNVLMGTDGPVVIDFPQAVDPASNSNARRLLLRDVDNLHRFLDRFTSHRRVPYAQEMWELFERNELTPGTILRGSFRDTRRQANTNDVLGLIGEAERDEGRRRARGRGPSPATARPQGQSGRGASGRTNAVSRSGPMVEVRSEGRTRTVHPGASTAPAAQSRVAQPRTAQPRAAQPASDTAAPAKKRRRRRRRPSSNASSATPD